jgi:hypothetical protein
VSNPVRTVRFVGITTEPCPGYPFGTVGAEFEAARSDGSTFPIVIPVQHGAHTTIAGMPVWGWNGVVGAPTLEPSIRFRWDGGEVFHCFLRRGRIELCADSTVGAV